jgi:charged multivesicular body protein 1
MAGNHDIARINAQNAVRKSTERLNLLRLASRLDAVASRVQTAVTMRNVSQNMMGVVKGMDTAMKSMNLDRISQVMDKFEQQFEDVDVMTGYYENATNVSTAVGTPQEDVERLMSQVADEAGLQLNKSLEEATPVRDRPVVTEEEEAGLESRLRALRN